MMDVGEISQKRHADDGDHDDTDGPDDGLQSSTRKRQRIRLSCLECRRRKLSCSRELPCDRCVKSATPERCTYEARPGGTAVATVSPVVRTTLASAELPLVSVTSDARHSISSQYVGRQSAGGLILKDPVARDHERIRKLELEVAQLRSALGRQSSVDGSTIAASPATLRDSTKDTPPTVWLQQTGGCWSADAMARPKSGKGAACLTGRYCGPHSAWTSVREITGISHFMRETAEEWLQPLNIQKKDRGKRRKDRELKFGLSDPVLEALLPSKAETDALVEEYLNQFEQLYRIVHIPTFKKEYASFWDPNHTRPAAFTALVMSMISVSCCTGIQNSSKFIGVKSSAFTMAEKWVKACDTWFAQQSNKHRRLVHIQIECLLHLAKRVNKLKKKRFWVTSGGLVRDAIIQGLHQEHDSSDSPYSKEMKRRIWSTMVEFDLQTSFDIGAPTLLSQVHIDAAAPRNVDDDSFDQDSTDIPISKPRSVYTFSSYAHLSRQSLATRLEIQRILTGPPIDLDWEQVLQFSDMITHAIDLLPPWDLDSEPVPGVPHKPSLAHTLLHIQLRQFLLPLHRPFLKLRKDHSKYQTSELIYYTAARDMVLMHDRLFHKGIRTLYFLREDTSIAALNLCQISLLQPRGSTSLINANNKETLELIGKCIALKEDRVLKCGNNDPWGYSSLCAAYGILETHLGHKTRDAAKAQAAERFISLHYKLLSYQVPVDGQQEGQPDGVGQQTNPSHDEPIAANSFPSATLCSATPLGPTPLSIPWSMAPMDSGQLLVPNPEFSFELLGSDLNDLWGDWGSIDLI